MSLGKDLPYEVCLKYILLIPHSGVWRFCICVMGEYLPINTCACVSNNSDLVRTGEKRDLQ